MSSMNGTAMGTGVFTPVNTIKPMTTMVTAEEAKMKAVEEEVNPAKKDISEVTVISAGSTFEGRINGSSEVRVFGNFIGDISCKNILIAATGSFNGNLHCSKARVEGTISGEIVSESLHATKTSYLKGNFYVENPAIEQGARVKGSFDTREAFSKIKPSTETNNVQPPVQVPLIKIDAVFGEQSSLNEFGDRLPVHSSPFVEGGNYDFDKAFA